MGGSRCHQAWWVRLPYAGIRIFNCRSMVGDSELKAGHWTRVIKIQVSSCNGNKHRRLWIIFLLCSARGELRLINARKKVTWSAAWIIFSLTLKPVFACSHASRKSQFSKWIDAVFVPTHCAPGRSRENIEIAIINEGPMDRSSMDPSFSSVHISPPYLCSTHCLVHILIGIQHVLVMKHAPLCYAQLRTESQNVVNTQSWGLRKTMESGLISRSAKGLQLK